MSSSCPVSGTHRKEGRADGPSKCTWFPTTTETSPHVHEDRRPSTHDRVCDTILDHIGNTPLVRINKITKAEGVECEVLAKCEFFNAGGSVKDRIGRRMILDAEREGRIKPGDTLIEPTSGNTGIGLALTAAIRGYRMIITLPEKMSQEKVDVLKALGAEIIRTPTEAAFDSPESHIGVAKRLNEQIPNSHILDQYCNPSNPLAHYDGTAVELLDQCDGRIDAVVIGAGTGGTITGTARRLKKELPHIKVYGVDPKGSILAEPEALNDDQRLVGYQVEGIGYDFIPDVLDRDIVDEWVKTDDTEAFNMARRLIREEGLLCGGSSGTAMAAAIRVAKTMPAGSRVVVVLPDSVRNYMTKFLNDGWMAEHSFIPRSAIKAPEAWWASHLVSELQLRTPITISTSVTCKRAVDLLHVEGIDQLPVVSEGGEVVGVVTEGNLTAKLIGGRIQPEDPVTKGIFRQFQQINRATTLGELSNIFDRDHFALVTATQRCVTDTGVDTKTIVYGVVSRIDLLNFIMAGGPASAEAASE